MVSQATQNFVESLLDAQIDFNIKLIICGLFAFYAFYLHFSTRNMNVDSFGKSVYILFSKIFIYATIFFGPLFTIMLFRGYSAIDMWSLVFAMYSVIFVITGIILIIVGWQKFFNVIGIDIDLGQVIKDKPRRGER